MLAIVGASAGEMSEPHSTKEPTRPAADPACEAAGLREAKRLRVRRAILRAALGEFARGGFEGAAVRVIAERAGVAKGTVHWHFGSKARLYLETVALASDEFHEVLSLVVDGRGVSFMEVVDSAVAFLRAHPETDRLLSSLLGGRPCEVVSEAARRVDARSVSMWRRWIARSGSDVRHLLPSASDARLARLIAATVAGVLTMRLPEEDFEVARALLADFGALIESSGRPAKEPFAAAGPARN